MNKEQILQCLKAVITYDKGEGVPIVQYDNQFLLDKEDIETLLNYINQLETNRDEAIEHIQKGIDNEEYNCSWERSWIEIQEDEENYFIDDYFTKSIEILERGKE